MSTQVPESILRKIQRCLALSQSSNANEAETALRQAQKMMEMHGVTAEGITASQLDEKTLNSKVSISKTKDWEVRLIATIGKAFGCKVLWTSGNGPLAYDTKTDYFGRYTLIGMKTQVELAHYTCDVMLRKVAKGRIAFTASLPADMSRGAKTVQADGWCKAWVQGVTRTIHAFANPDGVDAAIDARLDEYSKGKMVNPQQRQSGSFGAAAGAAAAAGESIHRPMNQRDPSLMIGR